MAHYQHLHVLRTTDDYRSLSEADLREYFERFLGSRGERISALKSAIEESLSLPGWKADMSGESFGSAGRWFATQVAVRPRTSEEMKDLRRKSLPGISLSDQELTDRTFSLAFDLGVYFGESLRASYPHLEWKQLLDDKLFVDYGQPVLTGLGRVPLNPFRIVSTFAYGVARKEQRSDRLSELYLYWAARAATSDGLRP